MEGVSHNFVVAAIFMLRCKCIFNAHNVVNDGRKARTQCHFAR